MESPTEPGHGSGAAALLATLRFAAHRHRHQRRKGAGAPPFINPAIEVADLLARVGVDDIHVLQAAVLHDTLEDTATRPEEIESEFGPEVRRLVEEVTDDKALERIERRQLQVEHAPALSTGAKLIRLADKLANVQAVAESPPVGWSTRRRLEYLEWTRDVVEGCRGCNPALEKLYDEALAHGLARVRAEVEEESR